MWPSVGETRIPLIASQETTMMKKGSSSIPFLSAIISELILNIKLAVAYALVKMSCIQTPRQILRIQDQHKPACYGLRFDYNPAIPVVNPDGTWGTSQADNQLGDINNPVATIYSNPVNNSNDRILANGFAELEILKGLKIRANYGYDQSTGDGSGFSIATPTQTRGPSISSLNENFGKNKSFLEEYFLTYNKKFNDVHDVNLTAGYSSQIFSGYSFSASRSGYSDTSVDQRILNLGNSSISR